MKCKTCGKEFEVKRKSAKYCSTKCRVKASRVSVTKDRVSVTDSVTKDRVSVTKREVSVTNVTDNVSVTENAKTKFKDCTIKQGSAKVRITRPPERPSQDWYKSDEYKNLIEELEQKPIKQLKEEGYFIPAWKYAGYKIKPNLEELKYH